MKTLSSSHSFNFLHPSNFNPSSSSSAFSPSSSLSFNKPQNKTPTTKSAPRTSTTTVTQTRNPNPKHKINKVFFLDVHSLCYEGAVVEGNGGSEYRRKLLPSYKADRVKFIRKISTPGFIGRFHPLISDVLGKCNVPFVKVDGHEADDVVATLAEQVLKKGFEVAIASRDKDFKQLISDKVQIVMPVPELQRWCFYSMKHYKDQYNCDPQSDLSFRSIIGDEADGVPGIQQLVPSFGRKTALKLIRKHGSLEALLNAAAVRTVGRPYAQDALKKHADYLRRNYEVLALKRDVNVKLYDEWLVERDTRNDTIVLSSLFKYLEESKERSNKLRMMRNY
ncbi:uncharacterized protein LOC131647472 isoform X2 [Vicia villosa]|uniref:uncharacterized protein LOC131647472 isoform X2 n=1 Tax=Vicia villosa TaxID=3911 RepID=UPI00273C5947|nr:uncharacterized protein LOC131647472 isoform X2 [Vicia villosa]